MTYIFENLADIAAYFTKQGAYARQHGNNPKGKTKNDQAHWIREASTYEAAANVVQNAVLQPTFNDGKERNEFTTWAATNLPDGAPLDIAWLVWKAARGG